MYAILVRLWNNVYESIYFNTVDKEQEDTADVGLENDLHEGTVSNGVDKEQEQMGDVGSGSALYKSIVFNKVDKVPEYMGEVRLGNDLQEGTVSNGVDKQEDYTGDVGLGNDLHVGTVSKVVDKEREIRKQIIESNYGPLFSEIVGPDRIDALPEMMAADLNLKKDSKYCSKVVAPSMLKENSAVRGVLGSGRPFIAIKVEMLDSQTKEVVDTVVELVFKRYPLKGDGGPNRVYENNYVTALINISDKGISYPSTLYGSCGMSNIQIEALRELLDGKEIKAPVGAYFLRQSK